MIVLFMMVCFRIVKKNDCLTSRIGYYYGSKLQIVIFITKYLCFLIPKVWLFLNINNWGE